MMNPWLIDAVGIAGALLTTFCWLPQVVKIVRERDTRAISFPANLACAVGVGCWLVYGAALPDWPLIGSSAVTLAFMGVILGLKLGHGCRHGGDFCAAPQVARMEPLRNPGPSVPHCASLHAGYSPGRNRAHGGVSCF